MAETPLVSIITPHYNSAEELRRLVASVPKVDWIEHIVVDDKSTIGVDEMEKLKADMEEAGVLFFTNDSSTKGAGASRNIALDHACGKWLLFADADDFFTEDAFDIVKAYLDSEYDMIYFPPTSRDSTRHVPYAKLVNTYIEKQDRPSLLSLRFYFAPVVSKLVRRSVVEENAIRHGTSVVANDVMLSTKCAYYAKSFYADPRSIYCITKREGTLTTTKKVENYRVRIDVYCEMCHFVKERLPREDYAEIRLSARGMLMDALRDYGPGEVLRTIRTLRKNKAPINLLRLRTWH